MDNKEINDAIKNIQKRYRTEVQEVEDNVQQSFIDELNSLLHLIFKDDSTDVYTTLNQEELLKWKERQKKNKWKHLFKFLSIRNIFYFILLCVITGFLVSEAVSFYTIAGVITVGTWVKAILTEVCFIFLSGYRATGLFQTSLAGFLRIAIFTLMLFVISSGITSVGVNTVSEINNISERIGLLDDQIKKKDDLIEFYKQKKWGLNAAKQETEKQELIDRLFKLKEQQVNEGKNKEATDVVIYNTYGKAAFRVILLLISILITRRLFKF